MAESITYMTPAQVNERWPFLSVRHLAQLRFKGAAERGQGPKFLKPTPKTVVYRESDVIAWLEASERTSTAMAS
ncbi:helix-turn-helix transcriptional regulator [Microbacterium sp. Leaf436]|uniref:helix-turn-helix transcriptional regulator n=1 Tax=Microbacterium sp. Leaf436 TaxID=1736377 RepID=UPI0006FD979E|nr:hypothetical protein [Microbacterium sp. Leaf436]KQT75654.1 hypothetical protein ASG45_04010 [Microbacterium sp. Leaf436]